MNKRTLFLLAVWLLMGSCSDDFLEKNQRNLTMISGKALISSQDPNPVIHIELGVAGSESFYITSYPIWMEWESMHGKFDEGVTSLKFRVKRPEGQSETATLQGIIVLDIDRIGLVGLEVVYGNIGNLPGVGSRIVPLSGSVRDAAMNKASELIVVATQSPDQLWFYQTASGESFTVPLPHSPQCVDFTNDGKTVLVGNTTATLLQVSVESRSVVKSFPLDCVAFDVVAAENGWCYIAPWGSEWTTLRSLNLTSGQLVTSKQFWSVTLYGNSIIRKVPGKPLLLGTRPQVGPTGILLFDISRGAANDTVNYWHKDLGNFWIFRDGDRFISGRGVVYAIPPYVANPGITPDPMEMGMIQLNYNEVYDMAFPGVSNTFFVASYDSWQTGGNSENRPVITRYDAGNYSRIGRFEPSLTAISQGGETILAHNQVRYLFVTSDGSHLYAVRRIAPEFSVESWSIEEFEVR